MTREALPTRRASITVKARIDGHAFYLGLGEYPDGRLGEIWLNSQKEGTHLRGVMIALARMVSVSLQNGTPVAEVCRTLRALNFPPQGIVSESDVKLCTSVADWIAQEIELLYQTPPGAPLVVACLPPADSAPARLQAADAALWTSVADAGVSAMTERVAGFISTGNPA